MIKVGDKVRIKKFSERPSHWNNHGEMDKWMGKVMTVKDKVSNRFFMEEDKCERPISGWAWRESDFVKVEEETMTKKNLKDGYVVEILNDEGETILCGIYHNKDDELAISGEHTWYPVKRLDDSLEYGGDKIMKIYGRSNNKASYKVSAEGRGLIWERVEPRKMTVAEIEEALGYPVEVVK